MSKESNSKQWYQHAWVWIVGIIVLLCIMIGGWYASDYNHLVDGQQAVDAQQSQVQNVLQRRYDTINEMVGATKGSLKQEKSVYGAIAKARTKYYNSSKKYNNASSASDKDNALTGQAGALNVMVGSIKEAYPHLSSSDRIHDLMTEIEGSNNRVSVERRNLNQDVGSYNSYVQNFPSNIVASHTNHHVIQQFHAGSVAQQAPKVNM